ncbi:MAG: dethiobiotin synthase [Sphingobium sp.]
MSKALIIAGTDTDVGKTVVAAGLVACLPDALYWKPVQAGLEPATDTEVVQALTGLPTECFLSEVYKFKTPVSPHHAARLEDVTIAPSLLSKPEVFAPLVIESAGGVMSPLTDNFLNIDLFARWQEPVILVARTALGTINHSLLSLTAMRARDVPIGGIIFVGDEQPETQEIITRLSGVWSLGRLPWMNSLDAARLHLAMQAHVDIAAIRAMLE